MRSRWTVRGLVVTLVATLVPAVAAPHAVAATGPSVPLPNVVPVPVQPETRKPREEDQATRRARTNNQPEVVAPAGSGSPTATSLSPSASWEVAAHTGDFTWSYPLRVPPAPGGLEPALALSYRSSSVDGHTSATNNQPSWIGDGWDMWPGFIERTYGTCSEDDSKTDDLCWRSDNATASYAGGSGMIICCDADGKWRAKTDNGSRIERFTGLSNGDNDGEHWRITTVDGTQYWFGSQQDAKSTWTVPVFGDDAGEPCHQSSFDSSHCVQAWRWNLDKIVDRNGNVIRYFYTTESNSYGFNKKDAAVSYIRGGTLDHIDYGLNEAVAGQATGKVEFAVANRCVAQSDCVFEQRGNWPDTPLKLRCESATCTEHGPSFWSTKRLDSVTTKVWRGSSYEPVDKWTLEQLFPGTGDLGAEQKESAVLWLKGIRHAGLVGGSLELPPVTFEGTLLPNRVDGDKDGFAPLSRYRISGVISEAGGVTSVNYAEPDCKAGQAMPANPETNTMRCFPVRWGPPGHEPRIDYFHKHVVASVMQTDMLAGGTEQITRYEYLDGAAWHWDMSEFAKDDKKTWNDFRGFGRVRTRTGADTDPGHSGRTMSEQRFYRGMDGDKLPGNGRRSASVTDSAGESRTDSDWLQGFGFQATAYVREDSADAPVVSRTITHPVWQGPKASRGEFHAYFVGTGRARDYIALKSGGWRTTETITSYDDRGLPLKVDDLGDLATGSDDLCTTTTYARDEGMWHLDRPGRAETVAVSCGATPRFPEHAIAGSRFTYDGKGNLIKTEIAKERPAAGPVYAVAGTAGYDVHGRITASTDALGNTMRAAFAPATGGPVTGTTVTSPSTPTLPSGLVTTTTVEPAFGTPIKVVDPNGRITETAFDALGRTSEAWLPNRPRVRNPQGSIKFSYLVRRDAATVITTTRIGPNGLYTSSNALFDGLLRPRQAQVPAVGMREVNGVEVPFDEGRLITDTRYDSHGRAYKTTQPYFNNAPVDTDLWFASDTEVPGLTRTKFDGAGRAEESVYQAGAVDKWKSTTKYDGDRVHTTPPVGGTTTTTITDARGQTAELRQYHGRSPEGAYDSTRYRYTPAGELSEVTGPDGAVWTYGYDLRGRKITTTDPDSGTTTTGYDEMGRVTSTRDSLGQVLATAYDALGRKTALHEDSLTGKKLAQWNFDTAGSGKGLPASSVRFVDGHAYTSEVSEYTALNKPLYTSVTVPAVEGKLAGTYETELTYGEDGSLSSETYPAVPAANVFAQTVNHEMDNWGRPTATRTGAGRQLVAETHYTRYGEVNRIEQGVTGNRAWQSFYYDTNTRRLNRSIVDAEVPKPMQSDVHYTYDEAGGITSIADLTAESPVDVQCFRQDHLRRLTEAWTAAARDWSVERGCAGTPTVADGPAPYWNSYTHGPGGNRLSETQRTATTSTTRQYEYPAPDQPQPHTLRAVNNTETYGYNAVGQTTSRVKPGANQTLTWDREGHVSSVTDNGKTTSFVYTADGARLLRKDPNGTTLYLDKQEIRLATGTSTPTVTRYYTHGAGTVAMHDGSSMSWLAGDHQGTSQIVMNPTTLAVTKRRQLPYGSPRGAEATWPDERGFVGGAKDSSTGLTHIGAREYDPAMGRFISVDPIMDPADPQQMHGYAYANNSPITFSDPTGLRIAGCEEWGLNCRTGEVIHPPNVTNPDTPNPHYCDGCNRGQGWPTTKGNYPSKVGSKGRPALDLSKMAKAPPLLRDLKRQFYEDNGEWYPLAGQEQLLDPIPGYVPPEDLSETARWIIAGAAVGAVVCALSVVCGAVVVGLLEASGPEAALATGVGAGAATIKGTSSVVRGLSGKSTLLSTARNEAVFWTREMGGEHVAAEWAAKNGGTTLEMAMARDGIRLGSSRDPANVKAWEEASEEFARNAGGRVRVLRVDSVRPESVWLREYDVLVKNPNVTSIVSINPRTGAETVLFTR
ncbi:RHS repeat-associated protein [Kibdelosporangium banguiense]|uniref:RHS repeat-associated protein n=1 Tax=Kibdelosporangium banguiense TaxID=1365924 RepID=A0ABS4U1Z8_9PSEU|nr:RHS repeat-associated core domain-containing protein [Kibdelosporangium banguiense]MBP2330660.1 RHS repeat-associated protein [Kibdelosporangium banguiense]